MRSFFSIIIPTLNEERFLPNLLADLSRQKERSFEVIVADGYSKDKTKDCVKVYKKGLRFNFIQSKKKNVAAQRNYGAKHAVGDYLVFLDADARIIPSFFRKVKKIILKQKGLLFIPYLLPDKEYRQYKPLFDLINILVELSQNLPRRFSLGGSIIMERNFFNRMGGFDESVFIAEDHELIQRAGLWGVKSKFVNEVGVSFSLRRMKKEGQLKFFYKYFVVSVRRLFSDEEIRNKIFEYQMGGQLYKDDKTKEKKEEFIDRYFKQIKRLLKTILSS